MWFQWTKCCRGFFEESEARAIRREICSALSFLHARGIAHRDLKPENILCSGPDQIHPVKICDFDLGSAGSSEDPFLPSCSTPLLKSPVGSAEFMAPEIVRCILLRRTYAEKEGYSKQCDTWSLGVLIYILISGVAPFQGECGNQCGWDDGESCENCMELLFRNIHKGRYYMNTNSWINVSEEAKDLIRSLLVRDSKKRMKAEDVIHHPWLCQPDGSNQDYLMKDVSHDMSHPSRKDEENVIQFEQRKESLLILSSPEESKLLRRRATRSVMRRNIRET